MALSNLIGRRTHHDLIDTVPKLAEKLHVDKLLLQFERLRFFVKVLIATNANISNELNFSDIFRKCKLPRVASKVYTSINTRKMKFIPEITTSSHA